MGAVGTELDIIEQDVVAFHDLHKRDHFMPPGFNVELLKLTYLSGSYRSIANASRF
jgi:hypothetical protein